MRRNSFWSKWLLYIVCSACGWIILPGCVASPRVIEIPSASNAVNTSPTRGSDYPEALAAMTSVMVRDLGFPEVHGVVTLYPNRSSFESALTVEYQKELEQVEKQFGPKAKTFFEGNINAVASQTAAHAVAVGMHQRVLVNESYFVKYPWGESMRVLAHELTHTVQKAFVDGRLTATDLWMIEGFAEWVAYKVLDALNVETFAKSRERNVDLMRRARYYQTFPPLTQLALVNDWQSWSRNLGYDATYRQSFIAVDFLIEQKGLPRVIEYFRLFRTLNNRERNFMTAFGEPVSAFEDKFRNHLKGVLGK